MNKLKLNGWQRLWVVLSCLYLITVLIYSAINYKDDIKVKDEDVYEKMSRDARASLVLPNSDGFLPEERDQGRSIIMLVNGKYIEKIYKIFGKKTNEEIVHDGFSEGKPLNNQTEVVHIGLIFFKPNVDDIDKQSVIKEYVTVLWAELKNKKYGFYVSYLLLWFVPCLIVYASGAIIGWIINGFKTV